MLQAILTGQAKSFALLTSALLLFLWFLPAVLAFRTGHRRFYLLAVLNIFASPILAINLLLQMLFPAAFAAATAMPPVIVGSLALGWLLLLLWSLKPGTPNPRLLAAQNTKAYDAIAALPLILWFAYGAMQLRPTIVNDVMLIGRGTADLFTWVQLFSLSAALAFDLLLVWMLVIRDRPVAKAKGVLPRVFGFAGTFLGVGILQLPQAHLTLPIQFLAAVLVGVGSLASVLVLWRLGKAFSIMPEARTLVTGGPYAHARHPLYAVEMITIIGTALQFVQPWAMLVAAAVCVLLVIRSVYEEGVLSATYPDYEAYRAKTKRFVPGVI